MKKAIINGVVSTKAQWGVGVLWRLREEVDGKKYAVFNHETKGIGKILHWEKDTFVSAEVTYRIGPDAIAILEI